MEEKKKLNPDETNPEETVSSGNNVMSPWAERFFKDVANKEDEGTEAPETVEASAIVKKENDVSPESSEEAPEASDELLTESCEEKKGAVNVFVLFLAFTLVIVVTVFVTFFAAKKMFSDDNGVKSVSSVSFADKTLDTDKIAKFQDIIEFIKQNYYKNYDMNVLIEGAIEGMVEALEDPYGNYYAPGAMDSYTSFIEGSYTGIGLQTSRNEQGFTVVQVYEDTPAAESGMEANDVVTHIDGKAVNELSDEELSALLKTEGTAIKLTGIKADGTAFEVSLTVEKIIVSSVAYKELDHNVKYINISQFISGTADEFKEALEKAASESCRGIIIDLRNNPGGYEREASAVADMILPEGTIATSRDRSDKILRTVTSDANEITVPVVLLVNQRSASAAELITGAFRDFKKGEIVGVRTYGKALAQINKTYESDGSGIVLTVSRYFTPSGECIDGVGIEPTVTVELAEEYKNTAPLDIPFEKDTQLEKAISIIENGAEG